MFRFKFFMFVILMGLFKAGESGESFEECLSVTYLGCYVDNSTRDLADTVNIQINIANLTISKCIQFCCQYYTRYAGLQASSQCFCSNSTIGKFGKANETDCKSKCTGNSSQICGGSWRNSVYQFVNPNKQPARNIENLPYGGKYLGCYIDNSTIRDLNVTNNVQVYFTGNSVENCTKFCGDHRCRYAGLQASSQCFCSNSTIGKYGQANEFDCWRKCDGNPNEYCGGNLRNSIYEITPATVPQLRSLNLPFDATYEGCYIDAADRDLSTTVNISTYIANITVEKCVSFCRNHSCSYAGLQSSSCFCSNSSTRKYGKASEFDCYYKCSGNQNQYCGGSYRNTVYKCQALPPLEKNLSYLPYDAKYEGCFYDASDRDLNVVSTWNSQMTIQSCIQFCYDRSATYAGVQNNYCSCGITDKRKYGNASEFECWMPCAGNSSQVCGGSWRNSIYKFKKIIQPNGSSLGLSYNVTYLGCFNDTSSRDLNLTVKDQVYISQITLVKCFEYCRSAYAKYAGVQAGSQCFCGNKTYGNFGKANESDCCIKCNGNSSQICGGSWRNSIYQLELKSPKVLPFGTKYMGCYIDQGTRDLDLTVKERVYFKNLTHEMCLQFCFERYASYFGVQYSGQCFCSKNDTRKYDQVDESECNMKCSGDRFEICGGSWRNNVYKFNPRPNPCDVSPAPCSSDQICEPGLDGGAICSCKQGFTKIATGQCCKSIGCGCWGDPHCHSFDGAPFEFQGRCKYDVISTTCYNKSLPSGFEPFSVQQKQEARVGVSNAANVAFVSHIAVLAYGYEIRMLKKNGSLFPYSLNGTIGYPPLDVSGRFTITLKGSNMILSCAFGLTIVWDGNNRVDYSLCSAYANYVCGLCGNADGNLTNDYVDRKNKIVPLNGTRYTQYYTWGSKYRVFDDSEINVTNSTCNPANEPEPVVGPTCKNEYLYDDNNWCGAMTNQSGIWSQCLLKMDSISKSSFLIGCSFDMCVYENNSNQSALLCGAYEKFNSECVQLTNTTFNWRTKLNCPSNCSVNQTYTVRQSCPKTCKYLDADYSCGELIAMEGCFCKENYVLDDNNKCILTSDCPQPDPLPYDAVYIGCYNDGVVRDLDLTLTIQTDFPTNTIKDCITFCYNHGAIIAGMQQSNKCYCSNNLTRKYQKANEISCNMNCAGASNEICGGIMVNSVYSFERQPDIIETDTTAAPTVASTSTQTATGTPLLEKTTDEPSESDLSFFNLGAGFSPSLNSNSTDVSSNFDLTGYCNDSTPRCYIYGDPHYLTLDSAKFMIGPNCTFLIASDSCNVSKPSTYQVYALQEYRGNASASYLGALKIIYGSKTYTIDKNLYVDNILTSVTYGSADDGVYVYRNNTMLVFSTKLFTLRYDGDHYFTFHKCNSDFCGVCSIISQSSNDYRVEYSKYLVNDPNYSVCHSPNVFPSVLAKP